MDQRPNNYNDQGPNGQGPNGNGGPGGPKNKSSLLVLLICVLATLLIWTVFSNILQSSTSKEITYDKFLEMLDKGEVKSVELQSGVLTIVPREQKVEGVEFEYSTTAMEDSTTLTARLLETEQKTGNKITFNEIQPDPTGSIIYTILSLLVPFVFLIILMNWLMRKMNKGGGMMGVGKSKAKAYVQQETGVTFKDVAGEDEAKESLQEVVDFLHNPGKYTTIGAKLPKGALLVGPPGTGKTLLAKAVAGEAHVPFFSLSGSDFVEMFVGVGASRVRDLFEQAKKSAPCIVFIDEIDAVGRQRGAGLGGGHDEREQTLNQLLVEMDGFGANEGIIMIAATNRPDILDPALLRPGRFDRQIVVDRPDIKGRQEILKVHVKGKPISSEVELGVIARRTPGFTGADLSNLVNEAALMAARKNKNKIDMPEMEEAAERVIMGPERRSRVISDKEKRLTAYHEGGHTLVGMLLDNTDPVHKVTIIPRGRAGGYTLSLPKEDRYYATRSEMLDELKVLLGGRVAEALVLKEISSGASNDLQRATSLARQMICEYGMSPELGPMTFGHRQDQVFLGRDIGRDKDYSEEVAAKIDKEIRKFIDEAYQKTESLLNENMDKLHLIADALIERETLEGEEIDQLMKYGKILSKEENTSEIGTPEPAEVQPAESSAAPSEQ